MKIRKGKELKMERKGGIAEVNQTEHLKKSFVMVLGFQNHFHNLLLSESVVSKIIANYYFQIIVGRKTTRVSLGSDYGRGGKVIPKRSL